MTLVEISIMVIMMERIIFSYSSFLEKVFRFAEQNEY